MKITADFLIDRRKRQWEKHHNIKKDEEFVLATAYEMTQNKMLLEEVIDNPERLIELCFTVVDKDKKVVPFFINEVQMEFINILNKAIKDYDEGKITSISILILKGRQQGFTTLITAYQLAITITRSNCEGLTLADKATNTEAIFQNKAKIVYNRLPEILKPSEKYNSKRQLLFEKLNSSWSIDTATKEVGRSRTINFFHGSECAFWKDGISSIQASLGETFTKNAIKIYESTANGYNDYQKMWDSEEHINCFFEWWKTKEYRLNFETKNMQTKFKNDIDRKTDWIYERLKWLRDEKHLDENQLYWYFKKYQGYIDKELIKQEYPCSPEEAFLTSGQCYFNAEKLVKRIEEIKEPIKIGYFLYELYNENIMSYRWIDDKNGFIKIYEDVIQMNPYVIGGDTAGEGSDNFTGQVVNNITGKQVAVLKRKFDEIEYTRQMYCLAMYYNKALMGIETNFSTYPTVKLSEMKYPNMYIRDKNPDDYRNMLETKIGVNTNRATRPHMLAILQTIVSEEIECIQDKDTLEEMLSFIVSEKGKAEAQEGCHDDLVMGAAIAYYIRPQQKYEMLQISQSEISKNDSFFGFGKPNTYSEKGDRIEVI